VQLGSRAKPILVHAAECIFPFVPISASAQKNSLLLKKTPETVTRGGLRTATTLCADSRRQSLAAFRQRQRFPQSHGSGSYAAAGRGA